MLNIEKENFVKKIAKQYTLSSEPKRELLAMTKPKLMLNDKQWKRLKSILLEIGLYDKPNLQKTVEGVLYRMQVGLPWRNLPKYFGKHNTVYKAFNRWSANNKLILLFNKIINQPDMEWVFIDGSHIKAHQHSSGANPKDQAIAKSRGGNTTKIHLAVDAHGNPITFIITDGTTHDIKMAKDLVDKVDLTNVVMLSADKGYDSQDFRAYVEKKRMQTFHENQIVSNPMTIWTGIYTSFGI